MPPDDLLPAPAGPSALWSTSAVCYISNLRTSYATTPNGQTDKEHGCVAGEVMRRNSTFMVISML